jgi:predicted alpha/beta hydrolase
MVLYFWHVLVPVATSLYGYFPGARLKKVGDVPRGVMLQWRRWCLHPRYHVGHEGEVLRERFAAAHFPIVALSITDDELMTERGTRVLIDCYENAPRELLRVAPADVNARRIGHFGFFRPQFEATLWTRVTQLFHRFGQGAFA